MATRDEIMALVDAPIWASDEELYNGRNPAIVRAISDELEELEARRWIKWSDVPRDLWDHDIIRNVDLARFFMAAFKLGAGLINSTEEMDIG